MSSMIGKRATVLILAGGYSDRFGEVKAFFPLEGRTFIQHVATRMNGIHDGLVISCKTGEARMREMFPDSTVIVDDSRIKGPMAGLRSSLPLIDSDYVIVVPCDIPRIQRDVIELLLERADGHDASIPRWSNGYLEPLTAVYRTNIFLRAVKDAWEGGIMKLSKVIDMLPDVVYVPVDEIRERDPGLETFINLNSPADLIYLSEMDDAGKEREGTSWQRMDPIDAGENAELPMVGKADQCEPCLPRRVYP